MDLIFEYLEDRNYFDLLLCDLEEDITAYSDLFDFRPPAIKRAEFNRIRNFQLEQLLMRFGKVCHLKCSPNCNVGSGLAIDHLIPLSSNKLNRLLRNFSTSRSLDGSIKKAPSQSFGSNAPRNLVLACNNCNAFKKHKILDRTSLKRILALYREPSGV
jgi:5-methylcytosine-specific restriction endonuclease McrA